ncbi:MAG: glycosyltransferase [bacterium]
MISFIIPTLNEEKIIEKTLKNLSEYTGEKEIIISDGNSKDKTIEIARKYTNKIAIHDGKTRQTIAGGRNAGAQLADGDFLVFLDADVYIPDINNFFSRALNIFKEKPHISTIIPSIRVFKELETFGDWLVFSTEDYVHILINNIIKIGGAGGEFQMVRTSIFKKIGGYNARLVVAEDHEFLRRAMKAGDVYFVKSLRIYHPGRRAHKIGWPRLLWQWTKNGVSNSLFKKSSNTEWEEIR